MVTIFFYALVVIASVAVLGSLCVVAQKALAPALAERRELSDLQRVVMQRGEEAGIKTATPQAVRRWLKSLTQEERQGLRAICAVRSTGGFDGENSRSGA